jgi:protein-S-isoprenylcysteine O-methyltransferase Ste14
MNTASHLSTATAQGSPRDGFLKNFLFGLPLMGWYALGLISQAPQLAQECASLLHGHSDPLVAIDILSRGAVLLFAAVLIGLVAFRKPATAGAPGFMPKLIAFLGAFLGVAIVALPRAKIGWQVEVVSTTLILGGMGFAVYALLWLGRSISVLSEARNLVTGGPYGLVRHPLYLGEETALIGVAMQFWSPAAAAILLLQFGFQLMRMRNEEDVLRKAFADYATYETRVRRIVPGLY